MSAVTMPLGARSIRDVGMQAHDVVRDVRSVSQTLTVLCSDAGNGSDAPLASSLHTMGYRVLSGTAALHAVGRGEGAGDAIVIVALDAASAERSLSQAAALDPQSSLRVLLCAPVEVVRHLAWARFHDFLAVPFSVTELAERLRRLTQRSLGAPVAQPCGGVLEAGDLIIDLAGRDVFLHGRSVRLTRLEFDLLAFFLAHPRRVLRRAELLAAVWGLADSFSRTVDIHLRRLRVKIGDDGLLIQTVRGVGYKLAADVKVVSTIAEAAAT